MSSVEPIEMADPTSLNEPTSRRASWPAFVIILSLIVTFAWWVFLIGVSVALVGQLW